jgi:hypothetical protein
MVHYLSLANYVPRPSARALKGAGVLRMHTSLFDAMIAVFDLQANGEYRFHIAITCARTKEHAGDVFYDNLYLISAPYFIQITNIFYSDDLEDAVNAICPFQWYTDITVCEG